jgi:hypothetical protein
MEYKFVYKHHKKFFWQYRIVVGHRYDQHTDKMCLFFTTGGVAEIPHWKDYEVKLGTDWVLAVKTSMEQQSGQAIPLHIKGGK